MDLSAAALGEQSAAQLSYEQRPYYSGLSKNRGFGMCTKCLGLISFLCTLAFANGLAHPADPALNELAGLPVTAMFFSSGAPGMVVALVRGPESLVGGLG